MSTYQKTLIAVLLLLSYSCYTELVVTGRLTEYVLGHQWIWIGDNVVFVLGWVAVVVCGLSLLIFTDTTDANAIGIFNEIYQTYPNSNKMKTETCWVFVPITILLIQFELYYQLAFATALGLAFFAMHIRYQTVCKKVKQVELIEQAKAGISE